MKRFLLCLALVPGMALAAEGPAADPFTGGHAAAGATKAATTCVACHGATGVSTNPEWPKLAGQGSAYLYAQLRAYQCGMQTPEQRKASNCEPRMHAVMGAQAMPLSDQEMKDLAAHFAAQPANPGVASVDAVKRAEKLYRAGDAARGVPACAACHGPTGAGNPGARYPRISGQHTKYASLALRAYRGGERALSTTGQMMTAVAAKLKDDEIEALASYVSGLQ